MNNAEANNTSYIYGNSRVASINKNKSLLIDTLNGSVNKIISKGNIETINYSPNGVTTKTNGYLYNGEAKDATGLIYLRARYYNPEIGIFIQIDSHQGKKKACYHKIDTPMQKTIHIRTSIQVNILLQH